MTVIALRVDRLTILASWDLIVFLELTKGCCRSMKRLVLLFVTV